MQRPRPLHPGLRLLDHLLLPFMYLIMGSVHERPQESHRWHAQQLRANDISSIDEDKAVTLCGTEHSRIQHGSGPLFHMPMFGGWRKYAVLRVAEDVTTWHIGWIVRDRETGKILRSEIHKLPLKEHAVRMLLGTPARETTFFAINAEGAQLPLQLLGRGQIGDGSIFQNIRLL